MNCFDISILESALKDIVVTAKVSDKVYGNRPKAVSGPSKDFVVASVNGSVEDMGAYGYCLVNIALFALDGTSGKNAVKLSKMQGKLIAAMPGSYDAKDSTGNVIASFEFDDKPTIIGDTGDDFGYHCRILQFSTAIKVL